jgi:hypothetical protein
MFRTVAALSLIFLSSCGYTLQGTHNRELEKEGVHSIYISPVRNDSYKVGIENVVFNSLQKSMATYNGIHLVSNPEDADAILSAVVTQADSQVAGTGASTGLAPNTIAAALPLILPPLKNEFVATLYNAELGVSFSLVRRDLTKAGGKKMIWSGYFNRSQIYQASNQLGSLGTTSMLINQSEFDRTIQGVSKDMMADAREAMLSRF